MTTEARSRGEELCAQDVPGAYLVVYIMKLIVQSRSGRETVPGGLEVRDGGSVEDLKSALHAAKPKLYPSRQRFTLPSKDGASKGMALADGKKLSDYDLGDGSVLIFKDLGPQIGYKVPPPLPSPSPQLSVI